MKKFALHLLLASSIWAVSCSDDADDKAPLVVPPAYDGTNFDANAAVEMKLRSNLVKLVNEAKKGRVNGQTVSSDSLRYWFGLDGANSLENTVTDDHGGLINSWIRARHGYPIEDEGAASPQGKRKMEAICAENQELKQRLSDVTERLAVLEKIATDPAERVSREIEKLR